MKCSISYNGISLDGSYTIDEPGKAVIVEMSSPYLRVSCKEIILRRDFKEYVSKNLDKIVRDVIIKIYEAVNYVEANFASCCEYMIEYEHLCLPAINRYREANDYADKIVRYEVTGNNKREVISVDPDKSIKEIMDELAECRGSFLEAVKLDQKLISKHLPDYKSGRVLLESAFGYVREQKSNNEINI